MFEKAISRRSFLNMGWKMSLGLLGLGMIAGVYPVMGERFWYQVKKVHLTLKNLPQAFEGWKIVQFSDVHLGFHYGVKEFRKVVEIMNSLNPDILFFTGDLVQTGYQYPDLAIHLLKELKAPRGGKWAVFGNHDYLTGEKVKKAWQDSQFHVLENNNKAIEYKQQYLYIAGLTDVLYGRADIETALLGLSEKDCVLLLVHEPDFAERSSRYPVSAQFSGHSHGGQVRIPFFGPIITAPQAERFMDGLYYVGQRQMPLYVNRGIGTTQIPIRLFCRPEITVFNLSRN